MGGFWVVLGRLGGGLKKLCGPISKDLGLNAGKGWEELGRIGTAGQKVGESCGKPKKSVAAHTFVQSCAFRSPARSGLMALGLICTLDFLYFFDLYPPLDLMALLGHAWLLLGCS